MRRKIETTGAPATPEAPRTSAAERTLGMFADEPAKREEAIKSVQNDALDRVIARREEAKKDVAAFSAAIGADAAKAFEGARPGIGPGFFGGESASPRSPKPDPPPEPSESRCSPRDHAGDEVTVELGEEMYGKPGAYSIYKTPAVSGKTRVRPGETRPEALARLAAELREFQDAQREISKARFLSHLEKAFT